ncbi:CAAX amino terminal protease self- immunity [Moraxella caprae]|uniref:CAAX amino terminal protease self- immunity n=2 Tax=Moraxella caprae TaxID=90240 RepID=A0A378R1I2_9GAMM|nr:type II CAAX endopeptidase family protein [Moraxella caprae]STZ09044.1 CAAX amino terminal protease self- immunity [Moraxella caprae]
MPLEPHDNDFDGNFDENWGYEEPLFSKIEILIFSIATLTLGIFSTFIFHFFNEEIIKVIYPLAYNEKLWFLILFKSSLCLLTFVVIWLVHYRLYHYSYESLSSYLGFNKPNWNFLLLWTIIFISLHSFQWANHTRAIHIRLSEDILTYGLWATLISTVIVAPICEEILIRGFLWRATLDAFQSERIALILSSAVFAFTHYNFDPTAVIFYFISSFIFVSARTAGGTLAFAIFLHFLHNFALMLETLVIMSK